MRRLLIIMLFTISSCHAMEMDNAVILEHKSEVTGKDSEGHAVNGHIEDTASNSQKNSEKNIGGQATKETRSSIKTE